MTNSTTFEIFDDFNRQYHGPNTREAKELYNFIKTNLSSKSFNDGQPLIEDYIKSIRNRKFKYIDVYKSFVQYVNKKYNENFHNGLGKEYVTYERRIELVKYLQQPRTRADALEEFCINERTLNSDFKALEEGISVLGIKMRFHFLKYNHLGRVMVDSNMTHSTVNIICLPLNMTELYFLTHDIPEIIKKNESAYLTYKEILNKIYLQLSDYALSLMKIDKKEIRNTPIYDYEVESLKKFQNLQLTYLLKNGKNDVTLILNEDGSRKEFTGEIKISSSGEFIISNQHIKKTITSKNFVGIKDFFKNYK